MDGSMFGGAVFAIIALVVTAGIFWLCRELFCWYWKFNKMVEFAELQRLELIAIKGLLKKLVAQGEAKAEANAEQAESAAGQSS